MKKQQLRNAKKLLILITAGVLASGNVWPVLAGMGRRELRADVTELSDLFILSEDEDGLEAVLSADRASYSDAGRATDSDADQATGSNASQEILTEVPRASATGDLWNDWNGTMDFAGSGTEEEPYQIGSLSQLMGLSELVAAGITFEDEYIELAVDLDLGGIVVNGGSWNPIGWYRSKDELAAAVRYPFQGHFDGCGNTISGLNIVNPSLNLQNLGLFGAVEGGSVKNLLVEADYVHGVDNVGILAGSVSGDTIICNVTVTGYLAAAEDAGGIAGQITGGSQKVIVENCTADGIIIYSDGAAGYTGGIAGNVQNAYLVDNTTLTYDGDSNRIYGRGYVGGIAGRMNKTDIYNSYVSGTIGGNGSKAAGGIVGKYESGNLVLARFDGDISRTNNGAASREGTFVGTREGNHNFTYGTGSSSNLSYLFAASGSKAKYVFGSNIDGDNTFTTAAHIGYWTDNEKKYTLVAGRQESGSGGRYFYEELEAGVKYIVTHKLGKEFTASGYYEGLSFRPDHFAPGYQGEPVRGYLVSVPRIDALNANGTYDTDVARLSALPAGNNSFYRTIDKDNPAAVANGVTVVITTAPKNSDGSRYQMIYDETEPGKVKPPTYTDEWGDVLPAAYQAGGTYTFRMPGSDTEVKAEYQKVTTKLTMTPSETMLTITHTRNGDRKNPSITTEVKNDDGILIARYIDGVRDNAVEIQPVSVHAEHNQAGGTADKMVKWSVDDIDLITNLSASGYTLSDARIMPNIDSEFIQGIISREVLAQINAGYKNKIDNTVYYKNAVLTAASNPVTSVDHQAVYGNAKLKVAFQIVDNTTIRVEGLGLNKSHLVYTITRLLTGDRVNPSESYSCSDPAILTATLNPARPFNKHVTWSDKESKKILTLDPSGDFTQDCTVAVRFDPLGEQNPAWIQNVINSDNEMRRLDRYRILSGKASYTEEITAVSEDQTHGHVMAACDITINFETVDKTVIYPERVQLDKNSLAFDLILTKTGSRRAPKLTWSGHNEIQLKAVVYPLLSDNNEYRPYQQAVNWKSADDSLVVENGIVNPNLKSGWITEVISKYPYEGTKETVLTVTTLEQGKQDICTVKLNVKVIDQTYSSGSGGGGGGSSSKGATAAGTKTAGNAPAGSVTGEWIQTADGKWTFLSGGRTYASEWAYIYNPYASLDQPRANWFRFSENGPMLIGWYQSQDGKLYYLNPYSDNTQGRMLTGWNWIDQNGDGTAECYYFSETGELLINVVSSDGYTIGQDGTWIIDGMVQRKKLVVAAADAVH